MGALRVEEVYKISGVPEHTFVRPSEYNTLKVGLRTPGRGVIVEGPSGIGKSTAVTKALQELGIVDRVTKLSARVAADVEYIDMLPDLKAFGTVVVDDFHRLSDVTKARIADLLKVTADEEDLHRQLVIIGINQAGRALTESSSDLANRVDIIRFEVEPQGKIEELISAGEAALNVNLEAKAMIVEKAQGSFYVAQMLCWDACVQAGVTEAAEIGHSIATSFSAVQRRVVQKQKDRFGSTIRAFARGTKFRPGGRAPYLHVLRWLADADSFSISIAEEMRKHASEKQSVGVVLDRGYLASLARDTEIAKLLHFDEDTKILSVEDPMLVFYLRNISWGDFIREVGFTKVDYSQEYDVALSFAGEDRAYADALRDSLEDLGHTVFYDLAEQHRFLGEDVEAFLGPIYQANSRFVVAVLGEHYGRKRWTLFEAAAYEARYALGEVIPVWSRRVPPLPADPTRGRGGLDYDPDGDARTQASGHADVISRKLHVE